MKSPSLSRLGPSAWLRDCTRTSSVARTRTVKDVSPSPGWSVTVPMPAPPSWRSWSWAPTSAFPVRPKCGAVSLTVLVSVGRRFLLEIQRPCEIRVALLQLVQGRRKPSRSVDSKSAAFSATPTSRSATPSADADLLAGRRASADDAACR